MRVLSDREREVVAAKEEAKKTFKQIGQELGVTANRAREIFLRAKRKFQPCGLLDSIGEPVSTRLLNCLLNENCETMEDVIKIHRDPTYGACYWKKQTGWLGVPNLGKSSFKELCGLIERYEERNKTGSGS